MRDLASARDARDSAMEWLPPAMRKRICNDKKCTGILYQDPTALQTFTTEYLLQLQKKKNKVAELRNAMTLCIEVAVIEHTLAGRPLARDWWSWTSEQWTVWIDKAIMEDKIRQQEEKQRLAEHEAHMARREKVVVDEGLPIPAPEEPAF